MFHQEVVSTLKEVGLRVVLVCSRRVSGPSPLHGTIVNNVDTDSSKQAFNTRVGWVPPVIRHTQLMATFLENIVRESSLSLGEQGEQPGDATDEGQERNIPDPGYLRQRDVSH